MQKEQTKKKTTKQNKNNNNSSNNNNNNNNNDNDNDNDDDVDNENDAAIMESLFLETARIMRKVMDRWQKVTWYKEMNLLEDHENGVNWQE